MKKKANVILVLIMLLVVSLGGACGRADSETNEIGLVYSGGLTEDKAFKGILRPGSTFNSIGFGSKVYKYRTDQRSYIGNAKNNGGDAGPIQVVSEDDVRLNVDFQLYFKLNQQEKVLRKFHENLGVKTKAWTKDGWAKMLREYFEPQIERSMEAVALKHKWRDLYASEEARVAFQNETIGRIKEAIREVVGDEYFCGPAYSGGKSKCGDFTFTVGKPEPINTDIIAAVEAEQVNASRIFEQQTKNLLIEKQLETERTIVALYGAEGALLKKAIESGKVTTIFIDGSGRMTVQNK